MTLNKATIIVLLRYRAMLEKIASPKQDDDNPTSLHHLLWMIDTSIDLLKQETKSKHNLFKVHRWLGYIQGCLVCANITTVEAERNFTRPFFRTEHEEYE